MFRAIFDFWKRPSRTPDSDQTGGVTEVSPPSDRKRPPRTPDNDQHDDHEGSAAEDNGSDESVVDIADERDHAVPTNLAAKLDDAVSQILGAFEEKLKYDASKQQAVDRLYAELQEYRVDRVAQATRPFICGMIRHHDQIGKLLAGHRADSEDGLSRDGVLGLLESLQKDVEDVLMANGVAAYRAEASEPFDAARQTVVGKARPTADEHQVGTIAECLHPGFEHQGKILVKARVSAYRHDQPSVGR